MVKKIKDSIKNIDNKILKIMKKGIIFSFIFCLIASYILVTYFQNYNPNVYNIGISLLESGLFFLNTCIICGFAFNKIIKETIE